MYCYVLTQGEAHNCTCSQAKLTVNNCEVLNTQISSSCTVNIRVSGTCVNLLIGQWENGC